MQEAEAASHDLRQPIHTIALLMGVLRLSHRDDASTDVVILLDSVLQSLSRQLDDLLDISKLDAGVVQVTQQPLWLGHFLGRQLDEIRNEAEAKGLVLRLKIEQDAHVLADPGLLDRVLRNLLNNAVKFTPRRLPSARRRDRHRGGARPAGTMARAARGHHQRRHRSGAAAIDRASGRG